MILIVRILEYYGEEMIGSLYFSKWEIVINN